MSREAHDRLSAVEIAHQIARTRARLSHSLMVLDREYALRNAVVHGIRLAHITEPDDRDVLRRHVVPLSLIGAGLAWLVFSENGDVTGRFLRGFAHIQRLARELLALSEQPEGKVPSTPQAYPAD